MKRMRLRRKRNVNIINRLMIIIIALMISIFYIFKMFNQKALPHFINYSEIEIKKIISSVITSSINEEISESINIKELIISNKDNNGEIESIDFNSSLVNELLIKASKIAEKNLKYLETGNIDKLNLNALYLNKYDKDKLKSGVIYEIPSGIIFNNNIFGNLLPKIPVKLELLGNIVCKLNTDIKSYGINSALITISIEVEVEVKILLPFVSKNIKAQSTIPLVIKIIEGNVPSYYFNGYMDTPMITTNLE